MAAFDPEGLIFATGINSECIKLYDLRSYDKGPFSNFLVDSTTSTSTEKDAADWTGLKVGCVFGLCYVLYLEYVAYFGRTDGPADGHTFLRV